jgi:maleylpyruvate isomerase
MPAEAWAGRGETIAGELPIADLLFIRWREVAVHHSDLGIGYTWSDWDGEYVRLELVRLSMLWASRKPMGMTELPRQALAVSAHQRVAWLLGRAEIEGLGPAGIIS